VYHRQRGDKFIRLKYQKQQSQWPTTVWGQTDNVNRAIDIAHIKDVFI